MSSVRLLIVLMPWLLLLSGCSLSALFPQAEVNRQLATYDSLSQLTGQIDNRTGGDGPIVLLLVQMNEETQQAEAIVAKQLMYGDSPFRFVRPPGHYFLIAFEDRNEDGKFQHAEPVGWHGSVTPLILKRNEQRNDLRIVMRPAAEARSLLPQLYHPKLPPLPTTIPKVVLGQIDSLQHRRFSPENGELGMWNPQQFMEQVETGVYFLSPYQREKIPVLFVHGVGGTPRHWHTLAQGLDQQRFQPWFFYYPSGLRLPLLGKVLSEQLIEMQQLYPFEKLVIVAHSMGGLVSRAAINELVRQQHAGMIDRFITLSTPWQGHAMAQKGVDYSPLLIPCWYDMAPGSPFLTHLFDTPLPKTLPHHLLFSYQGDGGLFMPDNSDGVIALKSQLRHEAQNNAAKVRGFNVNHNGIMHDSMVLSTLRQLLSSTP